MAELFEATWFFLPDIPPYAVCDDLQVLAAWAHRNVPRQGQRARPLLVDDDQRLYFLQADGSLSAVSRKPNYRSPSASERYWRVREVSTPGISGPTRRIRQTAGRTSRFR